MFLRNLLLAIIALLIFPVAASAEMWPSRSVKILVPYAAGGNSDGMARIAAQHLAEAFSQPYIVENRVGANGAIAGEAVAIAGGRLHVAVGRDTVDRHRPGARQAAL
jgi:tripartite-type tricarboxylate transporter receptor subunit TctC